MLEMLTRNSKRQSSQGSKSSSAAETEMLLQMLRRELLLALESMNRAVFKTKFDWIVETAGEFVDLVLMSGLDSDGKTALHIAVENRFLDAVSQILFIQRFIIFFIHF